MKLPQREFERKQSKYLAALAKDPLDFGARNDLGLLLWNAGKRKEAFEVFLEAVQRHPNNATAHANLGFMFLRGGALDHARALYEKALLLDPSHGEAKRGLAAVLAQSGGSAAQLLQTAGGENAVSVIPYRGNDTPVRATVLVSLGTGNVHVEKLLDDRKFSLTKVVVELFEPSRPLPEGDLVFNAIGDADSGSGALRAAAQLVRGAPRVLNYPDRVLATTRAENASRLATIPGVRAAKTLRLARLQLQQTDAPQRLADLGLHFPLLLRSPGHHTGHHFVRVDDAEQLRAAADELPGDELYAMEFIDVRSGDGKVRKFRVMFVDGKLYPLHLAISSDWKVHYFSAEMAGVPEHRAEDEAFLHDMTGVLGSVAMQALRNVASMLGLDYAGIDFALGPSGEVVVFEANATMVVVEPDEDARWAYRKLPVRRVMKAVESMVLARAEAT